MEKTTSDNSKVSWVGKIISSTVYCTLMAEWSDKTTPSEDGRAEVAGFYDVSHVLREEHCCTADS